MKKLLTFALALLFALSIIGCGKSDACKLSITVPAGSEKAFLVPWQNWCWMIENLLYL